MSLESRLARLERVVRWQRFTLVAVLMIGGAVVLMGADGEDTTKVETLETKRVIIVNDKGGVVATLGPKGLMLVSEKGNVVSLLGKSKDGMNSLQIMDDDGRLRIVAGANEKGGVVGVMGADGKPTWKAP